jgi:hypothetical protein
MAMSEARIDEFLGEELEKGSARSELLTIEGRNILKIRWITGKTSAGRLFGRHGRAGKPDFFRLIFGIVAGSLRERLPGDKASEVFNRLKSSREFRESVSSFFNEIKDWFFNEAVPRYRVSPGDVFVISTEIDIDLDTGRITWNRNNVQLIYWVRSDKVMETCRELARQSQEELSRRIRELEDENKALRAEIMELKGKLEDALRSLRI